MKNNTKFKKNRKNDTRKTKYRKYPVFFLLLSLATVFAIAGFFLYQRYLDDLSRVQYKTAKTTFDGGDYAGAEIILEDIIRRNPSFEEGYIMLGKVYESSAKIDKALELYQSYKNRWPKGPNAALMNKKIDNVKQLIKEDKRADKMFNMAENYKNSCQIKESLEWYQTIIENYPQSQAYQKALIEKWLLSASYIYHLWHKSTERLSKARDLLNSAEDFNFFSESVLKILSLSEKARNQAERYDLDMQREIQKFYTTHELLMSSIARPDLFRFEPKLLEIKTEKREGHEPEDVLIARAYNELIVPALYMEGYVPDWPSLNLLAAYIFLRSEKYYANAATLIMDIIEAGYIEQSNPAKKKAHELYQEL